MFGRRVDRAALGLLLAAGLYLLLLNTLGSVPAACALSFLCAAAADRLTGARHHRRCRPTPSQVRAAILGLASMDENEAERYLRALLERCRPGAAFRVAAVLKHPEATLSAGDILNAWKANRDADHLVIAATCPCEPRASLFARELREPAVSVTDSRRLSRLMRARNAGPLPPIPRSTAGERLRRAFSRACAARVSPRTGALAAGLLILYLIRGNMFNLFAAMALLARLGIALAQGRIGRDPF